MYMPCDVQYIFSLHLDALCNRKEVAATMKRFKRVNRVECLPTFKRYYLECLPQIAYGVNRILLFYDIRGNVPQNEY